LFTARTSSSTRQRSPSRRFAVEHPKPAAAAAGAPRGVCQAAKAASSTHAAAREACSTGCQKKMVGGGVGKPVDQQKHRPGPRSHGPGNVQGRRPAGPWTEAEGTRRPARRHRLGPRNRRFTDRHHKRQSRTSGQPQRRASRHQPRRPRSGPCLGPASRGNVEGGAGHGGRAGRQQRSERFLAGRRWISKSEAGRNKPPTPREGDRESGQARFQERQPSAEQVRPAGRPTAAGCRTAQPA